MAGIRRVKGTAQQGNEPLSPELLRRMFAGATERAIMEQTRHRSLKQVRQYIRRGSLFQDNAAARSKL